MQARTLFLATVVVAVACATSEFDSTEDGDGGDAGASGSKAPGRGGISGEGGESAGSAGASDGGTGGTDGNGGSRSGSAGTAAGGGGNTGGSGADTGGSQNTGGTAGSPVGGASSGVGGMGGASSGSSGTSGTGGASSGSSGTSGKGGTSGTGGTSGGGRPSCVGMSATACQGESCCAGSPVPALSYPRGRESECPMSCPNGCPLAVSCGDDEVPEHTATVDAFVLDKYEVTVGRFRRFVNAYDGWRAAGNPVAGAGAHPRGGMGWQSSWSVFLPASAAALGTAVTCNPGYATWTAAEGANETKPITCLTWYVAHAFCGWDGGRLPSEAEWEGAATGGNENRTYPWGDDAPSASLAVYGCRGNGDAGVACGLEDILAVGSKAQGAGRYGHLDLAGSVWEWTLDYDNNGSGYRATCNNCVESNGSSRVLRGGDWYEQGGELRAQNRNPRLPTQNAYGFGARCARSP